MSNSLFIFFMKISKLIAKIHGKLKFFIIKYFGDNKKADILIKLFISIIISSKYYYYISDRGYSKILVILLLSLILYIGLSLATYIFKILYKILRRLRAENVILFVMITFFTNEILLKVKKETDLTSWDIFLMAFIVSFVIFIFSKSFISFVKNKKKISIIFLLPSTVLLVSLVFFMFYKGESDQSGLKYVNLGNNSLESSAQFGSKVFEYGRKNEKNISLLNYVSYSGKKKKVRDTYFDKTLAEVPIKGRVWYPEKKEKSPVLFIAHGNHRFTAENFKGYDYLGRYLARRGYLVVSVDMNMLNGFMKYGLSGENDARAILLLENIKEVLNQNKNEKSKFYNLIDEDNIIIAGHSRGGEAAPIAQNYNKLKYNPDNGEEYDYNFNIKGVISISPTVDQYTPSGKTLKMENVNYLVLHGTHDKDVTGFQGMKHYDNTFFTDGSNNFKSAVYVGYANHGQFNEVWSSYDSDPPQSLFINRKSLLAEEVQKDILCKYTYEFLQNTFYNKDNRDFFKNPQDYNLPKTLYYSRYSDDTFINLVDFEEDYDLNTTKTGHSEFSNFSKVSEEELFIGGYGTGNTVLSLSNSNLGKYEIFLDEKIDGKEYLQFDVKTKKDENNYKETKLYMEIEDIYGNKSKLFVDDYIDIYPNIKVELSKLQAIDKSYKYKGSMQTVRIPVDDFISSSKIVRTDINKINIGFESDFYSSILIDNIGFSK